MTEIFISGAEGIEAMLRKLSKMSHETTVQALGDCAMHCRDTAIRYAPRSPTQKQLSKTRKVKKRTSRAMLIVAQVRAGMSALPFEALPHYCGTSDFCPVVAWQKEAYGLRGPSSRSGVSTPPDN